MTADIVIDIAREAFWLIIKCSAPMLLVSLTIGLLVSIFQTVTSIQEQTLTFVPKVLAIFLIIMLAGHWMLTEMANLMTNLWADFGVYVK